MQATIELLDIGIITGYILPPFSAPELGRVSMSCAWFRDRVHEYLPRWTLSLGLEPRLPNESMGSLLFALAVHKRNSTGIQVAASASHTAVVTDAGIVFTFGRGSSGRLGHGRELDEYLPRVVEMLAERRMSRVSPGAYHTLFLTSDGEVFSCGMGECGRLGHGGEVDERSPRLIEALLDRKVIQVAAGVWTTAVLTSKGEVFTFGSGGFGRLGHGAEVDETRPRLIESLVGKRVVQVVVGGSHTLVLTSDGEVFSFGSGEHGRLGHGVKTHENTPRRVESLVGKRVVQVAVGGHHSAVVTSDGEVLTFGKGCDGQLGHAEIHDENTPRQVQPLIGCQVTHVTAGMFHSAVMCDGKVMTFGKGANGQLGHGDTDDVSTPKVVELLASKNVATVNAGCGHHTVVLTIEGEILTFGKGLNGQLGHASTANENAPTVVEAFKYSHTNE